MSNNQLYILISPPLVAVFGIFFNAWRTDKRIDDLKDEVSVMRGDTKNEIGNLETRPEVRSMISEAR